MISRSRNAKRIAATLRIYGYKTSEIWVHDVGDKNLFIRVTDSDALKMGYPGISQMVHSLLNDKGVHVEYGEGKNDKELGYFRLYN